MNLRTAGKVVAFGLLAATGVNLLGGGTDGKVHLPGREPKCVVLQGPGWVPSTCGQRPADLPPTARFVEAPAVAGTGAWSDDQLAAEWTAAGGDPAKSRMAVAIARAESGGRPDAVGHNSNGTVDRGLWQINSIHGDLSTLDPAGNARAAVEISGNGSNWGPWTTYTSGAYRTYL